MKHVSSLLLVSLLSVLVLLSACDDDDNGGPQGDDDDDTVTDDDDDTDDGDDDDDDDTDGDEDGDTDGDEDGDIDDDDTDGDVDGDVDGDSDDDDDDTDGDVDGDSDDDDDDDIDGDIDGDVDGDSDDDDDDTDGDEDGDSDDDDDDTDGDVDGDSDDDDDDTDGDVDGDSDDDDDDIDGDEDQPVCDCQAGDICCTDGCHFDAEGTLCGEGLTECSDQDSCDGQGICQPNDFPQYTACGDEGSVCVNQDHCNGLGVCQDQGFVQDGTLCDGNNQCVSGACLDCFDANGCGSNATCNPATYACSCNAGYEGDGENCQDINGCADDPCFAGVTCSDVAAPGTGYTCGACPAGYEGDGESCSDINGCANNPCFDGVTCSDIAAPGTGYTCGACPTGYEGDGESCSDINGCANNPCFAGVQCSDVAAPGTGYTCGDCPTGYEGDGETCSDINGCADNPCFAGVQCSDVAAPGTGYTCGDCPAGYEGDGESCSDINGCADDPCFTGVECSDVAAPGTGYTCGACPTGYEGDGETCSDINGCADDPCFAGVTCHDVPAPGVGYFCGDCPSGYEYDAGTCIDLDECALGTDTCDDNATCTNRCGSYTCTCNEGYLGDGFDCEEEPPPPTCDNVDCGEHGTCVADDTCQCDVGYYTDPSTPSAYCEALLWCSGNGRCYDNGDCMDTGDGTGVGVCECYDHFFGTDCGEYLICPDDGGYAYAYEGVDLCGPYGDCELNPDTPESQLGICVCDEYVYGDECEYDRRYCNGIFYLDHDVCNGHGICEFYELYDSFYCTCRDGYDGFTCSAAECDSTVNGVCNGQGVCVKDLECRCNWPYTGRGCTEIAFCYGMSAYHPNVCNRHGTCVDYDTCECDPGYGGTNCLELECNCAPGYDPNQFCNACLPGHDPDQDCIGCLPGYDPDQNCDACAPGYNCYPNCIDTITCVDGVCTDPNTCFQWQESPTGGTMDEESALTHCENLDLNSVGWRLPNISELRTLVRNCSDIETGGACGVVDECAPCGVGPEDVCVDSSCWEESACNPSSCVDEGGPTGCYWPQELDGNCNTFWSSSSYVVSAGIYYAILAWTVDFFNGEAQTLQVEENSNARCMREGSAMCYSHGQLVSGGCICDEGYDPNQYCGACAEHYVGYPNCIPEFECTDGVCVDGKTGLEWQESPTGGTMDEESALTHCENLDLDGGGWRLPNISELRSIVRDNPRLETDGPCGVKDECASCGVGPEDVCLAFSCMSYACYEADEDLLVFDYCFWPQALGENCDGYYWSSSLYTSDTARAWIADFNSSGVSTSDKTNSMKVRCVRGGL